MMFLLTRFKETPVYLESKQKQSELQEALNTIAEFNSCKVASDVILEQKTQEKKLIS